MKIAVFNNVPETQHTGWIPVCLLERKDEHVMFIGKDRIPDGELNYGGLWMLNKKVEVIYVASCPKELSELLKKLGIESRDFHQMQSDEQLYRMVRNLL